MFCNVNGIRKNLGKKCTREELDSIKLIRNKVTCAVQALDPATLRVPVLPPAGAQAEVREAYDKQRQTFEEQARMFVKGAIDAKAEALSLEEFWWADMMSSYSLPPYTFIDFMTADFYQLMDVQGNPLDGNGNPIAS